MKPIFKILIVLAIILIMGLLIYLLWHQITRPKKITPPIAIQTPKQAPETPVEQNEARPQKISDQPIFDFWFSPETNDVFYLTLKGEVYNAQEGEDILYSSQTFSAPNFISPSANGQKILMAFGDPRAPQWGIFDINDRSWQPLPNDLLKATWTDSDQVLVGLVKSQQNISLSTIDLQSSPPKIKILIKDFRFKDIDLKWQAPNQILIIEKASAFYPSRVWALDLKTLSFKTLYGPENGLMLYFSEDKNYLFKYSSPSRLLAITSENQWSLFPPTLAQKCDSYSKIIYCFVPSSFSLENAVLPDDYFTRKTYSLDALFKNDLETGETDQIFLSGQENFPIIDAFNVKIKNDGTLYFINRYDNYLYEYPLAGQ